MFAQSCYNPIWPVNSAFNNVGIHTGYPPRNRPALKALHIDGIDNEYGNCPDPAIRLSYSTQAQECWGHLALRTPSNQFEDLALGLTYSNISSFGDLVLQAGRTGTSNLITSNLVLTNRNGNQYSKIKFGITPSVYQPDFEAMTIMNTGTTIASVGINNPNPKNDLTIGQCLNFYNGYSNINQVIGFNQYYNTGDYRMSSGVAAQIRYYKLAFGSLSLAIAQNGVADSPIDYTEANPSGYRGIVLKPYTNSTNLGIGTQAVSDCRTLIQAFGNDYSASALNILNTNTGNNSLFYVRNDGNIGIGTSSPDRKLTVMGDVQIGSSYYIGNQDGLNQRLSVDGQIACKEIIVELTTTNWPDDVFKTNYNLMPINQVEQNIRKYGHLPNIPSEGEVREKGVNLLDMQSKMLRKIEELTLYVIDLKKENESLKAKVSKIESQIK